MTKRIMKSLKDLLNDLNRTIYVGDRLESNLLALTIPSAVCLALGIVLIVIDFVTGNFTLLFAAIATVVASAGCAILHDIGKIGVPDSILNKPQRLTDVEYDIIKSHTTMGGDILKGRVNIGLAEDVARSHHERYDGKGYPRGP